MTKHRRKTEEEVKEIRRQLEDMGPVLTADGFDDCITGYCYTPGPGYRVVYSYELITQKLIEEEGLTYEEAVEHFEFNIEGAYVGEKTPIFQRPLP